MKKITWLSLVLVLVLVLSACGAKSNNTNNGESGSNGQTQPTDEPKTETVKLKVGATSRPHAELLNFVKPALKEQGVELEVVEFTDYIQLNTQVFEKQLDANFFQHTPFLDQDNKDRGYNLVNVGGVHIEPLGSYSKKIKDIAELKEGGLVAIPNDPSNGGRALSLLAANELIKLKEGVGVNGTVADIVDNPKKLKFKEIEAATLPRVLDEVELALINTNYALEAKLVPTKDALFIEGNDSPYVNIVVARPDNKDSDGIKKLVAALNTPEVKKFIEDEYKGAVVPAF
ncbi:MetQ/NlpA family ABC transporter substrate-binding protein [Paenibacillus sp. GCM10023252]|uniref:MetQ/NlpA family ABC transporter substrate-binding protein n=1 Tax=Paenibacillus sp. GCM10023252 TaxID=3252649 RepID=UPI003614C302